MRMRSLLMVVLFSHIDSSHIHLKVALEKELMENYSTNVIPLETQDARLRINASFYLLYVVDLDEREQVLKSTTWLSLTWKDPSLSWETKPKYSNVSVIYLEQHQIWRPDFILLNSVENLKLLGSDKVGVTVKRDGTVIWEPGQTFVSLCEVNIQMYPFDSQECSFWFGSWVYFNNIEGVLKTSNIGMNAYQENGKWEVIGSYASSSLVQYDYYSQPTMKFTLKLRRRRTYYLLTICIPLVILSIANCLVHILPVESGEKMSFCTTVLLSFLVFISFLNDSLPSTSTTVSLLVVYLVLVIGLSFMSVVNSVVVLYFWHKPDKDDKLPGSLTAICNKQNKHKEDNSRGSDRTAGEEFKSALSDYSELAHPRNEESNEQHKNGESNTTKFQRQARYLDRILFIISALLTLLITITMSVVMLFH